MAERPSDACSSTICQVGVFRTGMGHFDRKFQMEWGISHQLVTVVIALSCGIKISAVHCLVSSQNTRVTDGRTDRITTPKIALA